MSASVSGSIDKKLLKKAQMEADKEMMELFLQQMKEQFLDPD